MSPERHSGGLAARARYVLLQQWGISHQGRRCSSDDRRLSRNATCARQYDRASSPLRANRPEASACGRTLNNVRSRKRHLTFALGCQRTVLRRPSVSHAAPPGPYLLPTGPVCEMIAQDIRIDVGHIVLMTLQVAETANGDAIGAELSPPNA